jgi:LPS export ABC transporter protein LptC
MRISATIIAAALLAGCGQQSTTPSAPAEDFYLPADQVLIGLTHRMTNDGVLTALLLSDTAYVYEQSRRMDLMGVHVTFYTEQGAEAGTLTSLTADYDLANRIFIARGDVVLITRRTDGERRLETTQLYYDLRGDEISTSTPFVLHEAGRTSRGSTFRTDSRFNTWEVTGVETHGTVAGEGGITF